MYAASAKGVTNGDGHDHNGGDGAQIAYSSLGGLPTLGGAASLNVGTTAGTVAAGNDSRFTDARTPTTHATSHKSGGTDAIKLDELAAPTDVTTLNASTTAHGLAPKATAPASGLINVLGIANGETAYSNKALFDNTTPAALGTASAGTATVAARRDHVHDKQTILLPWGVYAGVGPFSADATPYAASGGYTMTLVNVVCGFYVATTNNASNYWTIAIDSKPSGTTIATLSTASASANTFAAVSSSLSGTVASSDKMLRVSLTKTGSPGNIYLASPNLEVKI